MDSKLPRSLMVLGGLLALGLAAAATILGVQVGRIGSGRQSIVVKGLAEKPVRADLAEWTTGLSVHGETFAEALEKLRAERPALDRFLAERGFAREALTVNGESVVPKMEDQETASGRVMMVQRGYDATQGITVRTADLAKVAAASRAILEWKAAGHPATFAEPHYLVSNLEEVKMSLVGAATRNARARAEEFAKNGNVRVGVMRSASQGAFYILAPGGGTDAGDYGGAYDKTTIDKIARVVVTIEYTIDR